MPKGYENPLAKYMTQEKYLEKVMISEVDESEGVKEAAADLEEEED
jgi:hypothetical protein